MITQFKYLNKDTGKEKRHSCVLWKGLSVPASTDLEAFNLDMEYSYTLPDLRLAVMELGPINLFLITSNEHALKYLGTGDDYTSRCLRQSLSATCWPAHKRQHKRAERHPDPPGCQLSARLWRLPKTQPCGCTHTNCNFPHTTACVHKASAEGLEMEAQAAVKTTQRTRSSWWLRVQRGGWRKSFPLNLWVIFAGKKNKNRSSEYRDDGRYKKKNTKVAERAHKCLGDQMSFQRVPTSVRLQHEVSSCRSSRVIIS